MDPGFPSRPPAHELFARADALRLRDPREASELARAAADACPAGSPERVRALLLLASCLNLLPDRLDEARSLLEALPGAVEDDATRCAALHELGECRALAEDLEAALEHLEAALALARELGLVARESAILSRIGGIHVTRGRFREGLAELLAALRLHGHPPTDGSALDDAAAWELGALHGRIAIAYSNLDDGPRAIRQYELALACFGERFPLRAGRTLYRMGIAAEEHLRDLDAAESYYGRAAELLGRHGSPAGAALGRTGLGRVLLERGRAEEAEALLAAALPALEADPAHRRYVADGVRSLGQARLRSGRPREALACFERALPLYLADRRPAPHLAALHHSFYEAHLALGDAQGALRHHEAFHRLQMTHAEERADWRLAEMLVHFETERAQRERDELQRLNRELHDLTIKDPLTGVFNRRHLDERLGGAFALAQRRGLPLSVMICDIDDFKAINDRHSHAAGDEVLRRVARTLHQHVRESDVVARVGGEEFVVVFPSSDLSEAAAACEKLRVLVAGHPWDEVAAGLRVTLSAGVAAIDAHRAPTDLLRAADRRLYGAKRAGKDRVVARDADRETLAPPSA